ncbi:MAG: hypothetical protein KF678_15100 [Phycisphaeraceae bacterium]|nr:hypothetical protein [Phycisphaeraceae bacterium]
MPDDFNEIVRCIMANAGRPPPNWKSRPFENRIVRNKTEPSLPTRDSLGNPIRYMEYDTRAHVAGVNRGQTRLVIGTDRSVYLTRDHYQAFTRLY